VLLLFLGAKLGNYQEMAKEKSRYLPSEQRKMFFFFAFHLLIRIFAG
jgi:hypothetical protein